MAFQSGKLHVPSALCALAGSLLIQIGTNFANDYFDHQKGADAPGRLGPVRATQAGLVAPRAMLAATAAVFMMACVPGLYIVWRGGWPFVAVGLLSILCGVL
jgi:1,4-dihydroxy-2-naphthoate octaprenyltransferase